MIPKDLRERAGLVAGTPVDFRFHDGAIEISVATHEPSWERVGRVRYPVREHGGLTTDQIVDLISAGRDDRIAT